MSLYVVFLMAVAESRRPLASVPKFSPNKKGAASLKSPSENSCFSWGLSCISMAFLQATILWKLALPINFREVWMAVMASDGRFNSFASSNVSTRSIAASSQNYCRRPTDLSAFFAPGEMLATTTASIIGHLVHRKSGIPFSCCSSAWHWMMLLRRLRLLWIG